LSGQVLVFGRESITQDKHDQAYELITYSHDVVDLKMVDFLITEEGIHPQGTIASYLTEFYKTH
jgi:translation initiation factor 2B subunit (eIF-2B alpha/beta/delta family)